MKQVSFLVKMLFSIISGLLFLCDGQVLSVSGAENLPSGTKLTYQLDYPVNQRGDLGYFDLKMQPKAQQTIYIYLTNQSEAELKVKVELARARTSAYGVIQYSPGLIENDAALQVDFLALITGPKLVSIPAKSSLAVPFELRMPSEHFAGVVAGGINLTPLDLDPTNKGVATTYSYGIAVVLRESDQHLSPDLSLKQIAVKGPAREQRLEINLVNTVAEFIFQLDLAVKVYPRASRQVLFQAQVKNLEMAPNSSLNFPFLMEEELKPGQYTASIEASTPERTWTWQEEFELVSLEKKAQNIRGMTVHNQEKKWKSYYTFTVTLVIAALLLTKYGQMKKIKRNQKP